LLIILASWLVIETLVLRRSLTRIPAAA
jgi:hypothetical protein